jgi:hypothetical protein
MLTETGPFKEKGGKLPGFSQEPLEMLFKAVGQPLGSAKKQRWADRYFFWTAGPLSAAQRTTEMIADQWTGNN